MTQDAITIAKACLRAYIDKDRAAIEALLADDFRFTSPLDNRLDRATYFARCWPNSARMQSFEVIHAAREGHRAFIVYEASTDTGKRFRNAELHTVSDGRLVEVEVYFGWNLPHPAAPGSFIEQESAGHA
jgi:ketosteroid isomerase-like protein